MQIEARQKPVRWARHDSCRWISYSAESGEPAIQKLPCYPDRVNRLRSRDEATVAHTAQLQKGSKRCDIFRSVTIRQKQISKRSRVSRQGRSRFRKRSLIKRRCSDTKEHPYQGCKAATKAMSCQSNIGCGGVGRFHLKKVLRRQQ